MHQHAAFDFEVPPKWNGELVIWAHGFTGSNKVLTVDAPPFGLRESLLKQGYAWAASSFPTTGYDAGSGVSSSRALAEYAATNMLGHRPSRTYIVGGSMGGHVVARSLEEYPDYYAGALSLCGQLGDNRLFDYYLDANVTAQALSGVDAYPAGEDYASTALPLIQKRLGITDLKPGGNPTTVAGQQYQKMVTDLSGGQRPGADGALGMYATALLAFAPGGPSVAQNLSTRYTPTSPVNINNTVERVAPASWDERNSMDLNGIPRITGNPRVPVMSLHDIGDLFVPLSMEQTYAKEVAANGQSRLLVQRGIRAANHCDFTNAEVGKAWKDLTGWVKERTAHGNKAVRPKGDDFTDRSAVASPTFGCRFSDSSAPQSESRDLFATCPDGDTKGASR
ncbi:alpha/beta hydrolase family protein [Streptomyces fractus]|uniref:alpha/beta hydrolase family protein n=1 Tax=Streptomyces fractus TaxID=641806 RepID=UPI003CF60E82